MISIIISAVFCIVSGYFAGYYHDQIILSTIMLILCGLHVLNLWCYSMLEGKRLLWDDIKKMLQK